MLPKPLLSIASTLLLLSSPTTAQTACNNSPSLCPRPYNNITHLGAHDSPFLRDASTSFSTSGNQYYNTTTQLDAGVRLLSAQVHQQNDSSGADAWHLCHSSCDLLDAGTLRDWLSNISSWMDANPNEVVTVLLVNSDDASAAELGAQFASSGIDKHAYAPPSPSSIPQQWPTLQTLISNKTRLLTFVASLSTPDPAFPYLMDEFTFVFENDFENTSPSNFSCNPNRPSSLSTPQQAQQSGRMFLMNHFLYSTQLFGIETPDVDSLNVTNAEAGSGSLGEAVGECAAVYGGRAPTFVLVDFFNVGPAIASVDAANGVSAPVGRKTVSEEQLAEITSGGARMGGAGRGSVSAVVVAVVVAVGFGL